MRYVIRSNGGQKTVWKLMYGVLAFVTSNILIEAVYSSEGYQFSVVEQVCGGSGKCSIIITRTRQPQNEVKWCVGELQIRRNTSQWLNDGHILCSNTSSFGIGTPPLIPNKPLPSGAVPLRGEIVPRLGPNHPWVPLAIYTSQLTGEIVVCAPVGSGQISCTDGTAEK